MKHLIYLAFLLAPFIASSQVTVHYKLRFEAGTQTYVVSMKSNTTYTNPLSRINTSTQVTIVAPHVAGGWTPTNITGLQAGTVPLTWQHSSLNEPPENPSKDYLFFAPQNATIYTPFTIPANTYIDIFSFKSGSGCAGDLYLFDNTADPLNANPVINADNNIVILGAGPGNKYVGNESGNISCQTCFSEAGTLGY
jgi:hypothetical protein